MLMAGHGWVSTQPGVLSRSSEHRSHSVLEKLAVRIGWLLADYFARKRTDAFTEDDFAYDVHFIQASPLPNTPIDGPREPAACIDGSFKNETTTNTIKLDKSANTINLKFNINDHPELAKPGTQWRFASPQKGMFRQWDVLGSPEKPNLIDKDSLDHITVELKPNTSLSRLKLFC
jgi:hypothetical protein